MSASVVDAGLDGRIGWPDEIRSHLHAMEREARALRDEVAAVLATGGAGDPALERAAEGLSAFLDDRSRSPLARALRRHPRDLAPEAAGRTSLDVRWARLQREAHAALERQEQAVAFRKGLARLQTRFGERLPWHLKRALQRLRIRESDAERPDSASLAARVRRLQHVEREMEALSDELPLQAEAPLEVVDWPEGVSAEELAHAVQAALADRSTRREAWRTTARALADMHATRLLGAGAAKPSLDPAEIVAREVTSLVQAGVRPAAEDVDAWGITLRASARERHPGSAPADQRPDTGAETGAILFVVPLFDRFVLVCTGQPWPVRVDGRSVRCGASSPVIAAIPPGQAGTPIETDRWATPLFDVDGVESSTWMETTRPAQIVPFARVAPDRWLAAVTERGALTPTNAPAWEPPPRRAARTIRLLPDSDQLRGWGALRTGPPIRNESGAFGWRTLTVPAPLADLTHVWLRIPTTPAGREHVEAEQAFFRAAELRLAGLTPRCLGRAADGEGYLYAPPLAFRAAESAALRTWEHDDPLAFVEAVVRLWQRLSDEGLALGFYHPSTLGFRVLSGGSGGPRLQAVALAAPLATLLGRTYRRTRETVKLFPAYERIGRRLPPPQLEGDVARPETEAMSLAVYALDRLLLGPLNSLDQAPWEEFVIALSAGHFAATYTAERLVAHLRSTANDVVP